MGYALVPISFATREDGSDEDGLRPPFPAKITNPSPRLSDFQVFA
jgi:hypothetical protein